MTLPEVSPRVSFDFTTTLVGGSTEMARPLVVLFINETGMASAGS